MTRLSNHQSAVTRRVSHPPLVNDHRHDQTSINSSMFGAHTFNVARLHSVIGVSFKTLEAVCEEEASYPNAPGPIHSDSTELVIEIRTTASMSCPVALPRPSRAIPIAMLEDLADQEQRFEDQSSELLAELDSAETMEESRCSTPSTCDSCSGLDSLLGAESVLMRMTSNLELALQSPASRKRLHSAHSDRPHLDTITANLQSALTPYSLESPSAQCVPPALNQVVRQTSQEKSILTSIEALLQEDMTTSVVFPDCTWKLSMAFSLFST